MNPSLSDAVITVGGSPEFALVLKATAVASAGLVASRFARRARASTRHLILAATFVILLLLPVASVSVRNVEIELPVPGLPAATATRTSPARPAMPPSDVTLRGQGATDDWRRPSVRPGVRAAWVAGMMFGALWLGVGVARLHRLRRHGLPWPESRIVVATLAGSAGVRQNVEIVLHEDVAAPVTCGWRRPVTLLPSDAPGWAAIDVRGRSSTSWSTCVAGIGRFTWLRAWPARCSGSTRSSGSHSDGCASRPSAPATMRYSCAPRAPATPLSSCSWLGG